jgi:hypothetical protein
MERVRVPAVGKGIMEGVSRLASSLMASAFVLALVLPSTMASAQSFRNRRIASTTPLDSGGTTPAVRQQISGWRQSNNFQSQIAALGTTPVASLPYQHLCLRLRMLLFLESPCGTDVSNCGTVVSNFSCADIGNAHEALLILSVGG